MNKRVLRIVGFLLPVIVLFAFPNVGIAQDAEAGKLVYDQWCAGCHGDTGAGDGEAAAYMLPRPRDFTNAVYQIRTTSSGELPTDADMRRVIDRGMPGSTMPGWKDKLSGRERDDVIAYLKTFSRFFEGAAPEAVASSRAPGGPTEEDLARGRELFDTELQCLRCHGDAGRGDGPSAAELTDDSGFPIRAADLTENWNFNGGGTLEDIFRSMRTGLDGTPMPSNWDVVEAGIVSEEDLWRVAQYVRSLSSEDLPVRRDVIRAARMLEGLPTGPDDAAWGDIEASYVPMVGQITVAPRWFAPTVDGLFVQAAHDDQQLAIKITWNDPTQSPDPDWAPFFDGVKQFVVAADSAHVEEQGPDRLHVQFPLRQPDGTELPFFLGGDVASPVYTIQWTSSPDAVRTGTSTGLGAFVAATAADVTHQSSFADGQWQLQLTRPLVPADSSVSSVFGTGEPISIAFYAADGTDAEDEIRGSVSSWYAIYLDIPTPSSVYIAPVVATLLTAAIGMVIVLRAQQNHRRA